MRLIAFIMFLLVSNSAHARDPAVANCVDMAEAGNPLNFSVTRLNGLDLNGVIKVPSSGYSYTLSQGAFEEGVLHMTLTLTPPDMGLTVISDLVVSEQLENVPYNVRTVNIHVDKTFKWGADEILCQL